MTRCAPGWWLDLPLTRGRVWASLGDAEDGEDGKVFLCIGDVIDDNNVLLLLNMIRVVMIFWGQTFG